MSSAAGAASLTAGHPAAAAGAAGAAATPTRCQARTRVYRNGVLAGEGVPVLDMSDQLRDDSVFVWLDLLDPDQDDLSVLSAEFGLHPLAVEDAVQEQQRTKLDRYRSHQFLAAYAIRLDRETCELAASEVAVFITESALITVRKDDGLDIAAVLGYWDANPDLAKGGVGYLLHGLLDYIVDGYFAAVEALDDKIDELEELLFTGPPGDLGGAVVQRRSFELRKSLLLLRRLVLPMREVVSTVLHRDLRLVSDSLQPYYQDVYDHALRATEWTESLRDLVTTILETNLTMAGNRMNVISKKVTSWAAIIAVPTFITGFYGMNVPYPGFGRAWGVLVAAGIMVVSAVTLYLVFRRKDWL
jgi:magnesium transporter